MNKIKVFLILAGLCILVYANSLRGSFVSDDTEIMTNEAKVSSFSQTCKDLPSMLYTVGYKIGKFNPIPHHMISLILHIIVTCAVFSFLGLFFGANASLMGAIIFALHPIHTEAVSWISGRPYILIALFTLLPYLIYHEATKGKFKLGLYLLSVIMCFYWSGQGNGVGFYSSFPLFIVIMDMYFGKVEKNKLLWIPFFMIIMFSFVGQGGSIESRIASQSGSSLLGWIIDFTDGGFIFWWVNGVFSLGTNLKLLLLPLNLTIFHEPFIINVIQMKYWLLTGITSLLLLPFFFIGYGVIKKTYLIVALFTLWLLPTFSPIRIASLVADRYLYLPTVCLCMFIAMLFETKIPKKPFVCLFVCLCIFYSVRTVMRNSDYSSPLVYWTKTAKASPHSYRAHNNLGIELIKLKEYSQAEIAFKHSLLSKPNHYQAIDNLKILAKLQGKTIKKIEFKNNPKFNMDFTKE